MRRIGARPRGPSSEKPDAPRNISIERGLMMTALETKELPVKFVPR